MLVRHGFKPACTSTKVAEKLGTQQNDSGGQRRQIILAVYAGGAAISAELNRKKPGFRFILSILVDST